MAVTFATTPELAYQHYQRDGYFIEPDVLTAAECDAVIAAAERLPTARDGSYAPTMNVHKLDDAFVEVMSHPKVVAVMRRLVHGTPYGLHTQMFFTPPERAGLGVHQDNFFVEANQDAFASAWIPLVDVTPQNGGIYTYPGLHTLGALPVRPAATDGDRRQTVYEETLVPPDWPRQDVTMRRGSVLYLHGYNVHGSHQNQSSGKRYVILNTYIREGEAFRPGETAKREPFALRLAS
jgi:ectoine hydroxylase-related dioxygenase (phytanoyl-CoA dioxygenase family)